VDKITLVHAFKDTIVCKCLSNRKRNDNQSPFHAHNHVYSKKRLLGKTEKNPQPKKMTPIDLLQYIQPHQLKKCFLKQEKRKIHPPTLCFNSFFSLIPKWKDMGY
jgi:hypothetical protein